MPKGLSLREFARREGCDEKVVRRKLQSGHLTALRDGSIDPSLIGSEWRSGGSRGADSADTTAAVSAAGVRSSEDEPEHIGEVVERMMRGALESGTALMTKHQAETMKENYLALLRQLEYDRASGIVAPIEDFRKAFAFELNIVRTHLTNLGARVAPRAAVMRNAEEVKSMIDAEVHRLLDATRLALAPLVPGDDEGDAGTKTTRKGAKR